jgi:hypothetical protein
MIPLAASTRLLMITMEAFVPFTFKKNAGTILVCPVECHPPLPSENMQRGPGRNDIPRVDDEHDTKK